MYINIEPLVGSVLVVETLSLRSLNHTKSQLEQDK